jgi:hypothetical protein
VGKRQFKDASSLYKQAADTFKEHIKKTENREIQSALTILVEQCNKRASELGSLENMKTPIITPMAAPKDPKDSILGSLANVRGIMSTQLPENDDLDPLTRFQLQVLSLLKSPNITIDEPKPLEYKPSGKSIEELEMENASLKVLLSQCSENLQLYESLHKKVKLSLKNDLAMLKRELQQQDRVKKQEYESKIEALIKENQKLESTTRKLTQRWNELVESAKRRRDDKK